jgi:peroxiredoxin
MSRLRLDARKLRSLVLNAGLVVAVFLLVSAFQSRNMLSTDAQDAPGLRGVTLSGDIYDIDDMGAKPALVYFFAPWCKICAASADNLARLSRWRDADEIEIVAVALDWQTADEVRIYAERHGLNLTVVLGDTTVARQWRIQAYPSYYVLNSERQIVRRDIGYSSQAGLWWRAWTVS